MVKDLKVDKDRCMGCGICADVCMTQEIALSDDKIPWALRPDEDCVKCGHCVVACPTAALTAGEIAPESCQPYDLKELPSTQQADLLLRTRRSTRNFLDKPVTRDTIQGIIEVARFSPSGINAQPVRWLVVQDKAKVKKNASMTIDWLRFISKDPAWIKRIPLVPRYVSDWDSGRDTILFGAPSLVMTYAESRWEEECKMAMTFLDLAAHSRGLGTCWMGLMNLAANLWEPLKNELALPEGTQSFGIMTLGYPKYNYLRIPYRREARITWK